MIKLLLLTGFLGAGKTTLLKEILSTLKNHRVGVIINEFGEINVDKLLIGECDVSLRELVGGSCFCSCIKENFLRHLIDMSALDLEFLIVEATGLADPSTMGQIVRSVSHKLKNQYDYVGAICVVDCDLFLSLFDLLPVIERQIMFSSTLIINKSDLFSAETVARVVDHTKKVNPLARVHVTSFCKFDVHLAISEMRACEDIDAVTLNTPASRAKTFTLNAKTVVDHTSLLIFLASVTQYAFRIKGFIETTMGVAQISCVGEKVGVDVISLEDCDGFKGGLPLGLVAISSVGIRFFSIATEQSNLILGGDIVL